jgi:hypothetical protein
MFQKSLNIVTLLKSFHEEYFLAIINKLKFIEKEINV